MLRKVLVYSVFALLTITTFAVPTTMNYQARVTDIAGVPIDGTRDITFSIYESATPPGSAIWSETHYSVNIVDGFFSVRLGDAGTPLDIPFDRQYWMEITIGTDVLSPREPLSTVAYSFTAGNADSLCGYNICDMAWYADSMLKYLAARGYPIDSALAWTQMTDSLRSILWSYAISEDTLYSWADFLGYLHDEVMARGWNIDTLNKFVYYFDKAIELTDSIYSRYHWTEDSLWAFFDYLDSLRALNADSIINWYIDSLVTEYPLDTLASMWNNSDLGLAAYGDSAGLIGLGGMVGGWFEGDSAGIYATNTGAGVLSAYLDGDVYIDGKLTVTGLVDPTGYSYTPQTVNPLSAGMPGTWVDDVGQQLHYYDGTTDFIVGGDNDWTRVGNLLYPNFLADSVGIGTTTPNYKLHVEGEPEDWEAVGYFQNNYVGTEDGIGIYAVSVPIDYYGIGVIGEGGYIGVEGDVYPTGSDYYYGVYGYVDGGDGYNFAVYGDAWGDGMNFGLYGVASDNGSGMSTNFGAYADAWGGDENYGIYATAGGGSINFAGYFDGDVYIDQNVGIGEPNPVEALDVVGNIQATGTILSGTSIIIDGTTNPGTITETNGTISFDDEDLITTGTITANTFVGDISGSETDPLSVHLTGNQTVAGQKTFTDPMTISNTDLHIYPLNYDEAIWIESDPGPEPSVSTWLANAAYADDGIRALGDSRIDGGLCGFEPGLGWTATYGLVRDAGSNPYLIGGLGIVTPIFKAAVSGISLDPSSYAGLFSGNVLIDAGLDDGTGFGAPGDVLTTDGIDIAWSSFAGLETDPVFTASDAFGITAGDIANWNTAFGWGDHSLAGYLLAGDNVSLLVNDAGYVDCAGVPACETDPIYSGDPASGILAGDIANWDAAFGWGDHSLAGYLLAGDNVSLLVNDAGYVDCAGVSACETDPIYSGDPASGILAGDIANWDAAFGWGDHSLAGYLTEVRFDTLNATAHDTVVVSEALKVMGELIADSIQAVDDVVQIDDALYIQDSIWFDGSWHTTWGSSNWLRNGNLIYPENTSDSVGIGTTTPNYKLHVEGEPEDWEAVGYFQNNYVGTEDGIGIYAVSVPIDYYGIGVIGEGGYIGVEGDVYPTGSDYYYGVYGYIDGGDGYNYALYGESYGDGENYGAYLNAFDNGSGFSINYGVYADAWGGDENYGIYATAGGGSINFAGYFDGDVYIAGWSEFDDDVDFNFDIYISGGINDGVGFGSAGEVLTADGAGNFSWQVPATARFDTLNATAHDTVVVSEALKVMGELIADSIQAVIDTVYIDDDILIDGSGVFQTANTPTILYTESFESGDPPTGWAETDVVGTADLSYLGASQNPAGYSPTDGATLVNFNSHTCANGDQIQLEQTSSFSTVGYNLVIVYFDMLHDTDYSGNNDKVVVRYSTDGTVWNNAATCFRHDGTTGWSTESVTLPAGANNQPTLFIAFLFISYNGNDMHIDNMVVQGYTSASPMGEVTIANGDIDANGIITASGGNSDEWNTAYSWGDHSTMGYITCADVPGCETDPQVGANSPNYIPKWNGTALVQGTLFDNGNIGIDVIPSSKLDVDGDIEVGDADAFYFGDPNTDGTWRIIRVGNNLEFQRRESGVWNTKDTMTP